MGPRGCTGAHWSPCPRVGGVLYTYRHTHPRTHTPGAGCNPAPPPLRGSAAGRAAAALSPYRRQRGSALGTKPVPRPQPYLRPRPCPVKVRRNGATGLQSGKSRLEAGDARGGGLRGEVAVGWGWRGVRFQRPRRKARIEPRKGVREVGVGFPHLPGMAGSSAPAARISASLIAWR